MGVGIDEVINFIILCRSIVLSDTISCTALANTTVASLLFRVFSITVPDGPNQLIASSTLTRLFTAADL